MTIDTAKIRSTFPQSETDCKQGPEKCVYCAVRHLTAALDAAEKAVGVWNGKAVHRGKECTRLRRERDEARERFAIHKNQADARIEQLRAENERLRAVRDAAWGLVSYLDKTEMSRVHYGDVLSALAAAEREGE